MPKTKIYRLSPETIELCKNKIAVRNPSLDKDDLVYVGDILIARALGNNNFKYLVPLADKNNTPSTPSTLSTLKQFLFALGIIKSRSDSVDDYITVDDEQPPAVTSKTSPPPTESIVISGIKKESSEFCFLPDDATAIKNEIEKRRKAGENITRSYLFGPSHGNTSNYVSKSLNSQPVYFLDFIKILNALIDRNIVTLKKGITIEGLFALPDVDEKNPLELSKEDIHFRGSWICLSEEAISKINALLFKKNLTLESFFPQLEETSTKDVTLRSFLRGAKIQKNSFLKILNLLAEQGVLEQPKTSFDALLSFDIVKENFQITRPNEGETRLLLKQAAANEIQARLQAQQITHKKVANQANIENEIVNDFLSGGAETINPEKLKKILHVLIENKIITLPDGTDLDAFVDAVAAMEPSFPRTSATAATCASAGSNSNAQIALAAAIEAQGRSAGS
jgi:predicted XRE-type DNA-binding protein